MGVTWEEEGQNKIMEDSGWSQTLYPKSMLYHLR